MPHRHCIHVALLSTALLAAAVAVAQDTASPSRDARTAIEVLDRGTGTPVVLRWRTDDTVPVTVQVSTRTVPAVVESPGLDDTEPDVRLAGFQRPPIEKAWTLQGRLDRATDDDSDTTGTVEARWRVIDAAARLVGIRPVTAPPAETTPDTVDGPGQAPPRDDQPARKETLSPETKDVQRGSDPELLAKAIVFERITNESLQKTDGAAITQVLGSEGLRPAAGTVRLVAADRRADFETSGLVSIMTLAQPALPSEPLGVGASWRTRWTSMVQSAPVVIDAIWTVKSFDEAATTTGVADTAVLRVEFTRVVAEGARVHDSQQAAIEVSGRGEVTTTFGRPLRLEGRFVETPIVTIPGRSTDVTRMRLTPIATR